MASYSLKHLKSGKALDLLEGNKFVIGRSRSCDIRVKTDQASRRHCEIEISAQGAIARDLGSRNGTKINGTRIDGDHLLQDGDEIKVGSVAFEFSVRKPGEDDTQQIDDTMPGGSDTQRSGASSDEMFTSLLAELKALRSAETAESVAGFVEHVNRDTKNADELEDTLAEPPADDETTDAQEVQKKKHQSSDDHATTADMARDAIEKHFRRRL